MPHTRRLPALSGRFASGLGGAWLFARWLLVLAMVFDLVSAPFHHHHHDGVEVQLELGASHDHPGSVESHVDSDEHLAGSHFAMAIRVDPSRIGQLPAVDPADAAIAVNASLLLLAALDNPEPERWVRDQSTPDLRTHRSLPPAGRAPPLHA